MVPRFQINKRPSILNTNGLNDDNNDIDVIINEVYDKTEEEENRKSISFSFLEKVKKLQTSKKSSASSSAGVTVKYQSYGSKSQVTQSPYKIQARENQAKNWLKLTIFRSTQQLPKSQSSAPHPLQFTSAQTDTTIVSSRFK